MDLTHAVLALWIENAMHTLAPKRDTAPLAHALAEQIVVAHEGARTDTMLTIAAVEVAVMFRESSLDNAALGDKDARGEPTSYCAGQINLPGATRTAEGWDGADLVEREDRCVAVVDRMVSGSIAACAKLPMEERLASYARGSCASERGQKISRDRFWIARGLLRRVDVDRDGEPEAYDVPAAAPPVNPGT